MIETVESKGREPAAKAKGYSIQGVSKAYGDLVVLNGITLNLRPGEITTIVGRSGCGKSTFLRILSGLEGSSNGRILIRGSLLEGLNQDARLMFQDAALLPWQTVLENVLLATPKNRDRRAVAQAALEQVGLADRAKDWPAVLSGGQRQRIALARALASSAGLLLFDEPLGALDALTRLEMQQLIERLWEARRFTAVLVTHDVEEAVALGDRVLVMQQGQVTFDREVELLRPRNRLSHEFSELKQDLLNAVLQRV